MKPLSDVLVLLLVCNTGVSGATLPEINFGTCGFFKSTKRVYQAIDFAAKLALEEGLLDRAVHNRSFVAKITAVSTNCVQGTASEVSLPLFLGKGQVQGRIYSSVASEPAIGISGCQCSSASKVVANLGTRFKVTMVSGSATSTELTEFPYFARTIPPDTSQAKGLAWILGVFKWRRAVVLQSEGSSYSAGIGDGMYATVNSLLFRDKFGHIELIQKQMPTNMHADSGMVSYTRFRESVMQINSMKPRPTIFIVAGTTSLAVQATCAFEEFGMTGRDNAWLLSESLCQTSVLSATSSDDTLAENLLQAGWTRCKVDIMTTLLGAICLQPISRGPLYSSSRWQQFWTQLSCQRLIAAGMPNSSAFPCNDSHFTDMSLFNSNMYYPLRFDSMTALFVGVSDMLQKGIPAVDIRGEAFKESVFNARFEGLSGTVAFDHAGDRLSAYGVWNLQKLPGTLSDFVEVGTYDSVNDLLTLSKDPQFADGSTTPPSWRAAPCGVGSEFDGIQRLCVPCPLGLFNAYNDSDCLECLAGTFTSVTGTTSCEQAPAGHCVEKRGASRASVCPSGTYAAAQGLTACSPCPADTISAPGSSWCQPCEQGSYRTGPSTCDRCLGDLTTQGAGAVRQEQCICPEGSFRDIEHRTRCHACVPGVFCPAGSDQSPIGNTLPKVTQGYTAALVDNRIATFRCSAEACKGNRSLFDAHGFVGEGNLCTAGFSGLSCSACEDGYYRDGNSCKPCRDLAFGKSKFVWFLMKILFVCFTSALIYYRNSFPPGPMWKAQQSFVDFAQAFFVIGAKHRALPNFAVDFVQALEFLELDLEVLGLPNDCGIGTSFMARYIFNIAWPVWLWLGFLTLLLGSHLFVICTKPCSGPHLHRATSTNFRQSVTSMSQKVNSMSQKIRGVTMKDVLMAYYPCNKYSIVSSIMVTQCALFITVTFTSTLLFRFIEQPSGVWTMSAFPDVIRYSSLWFTALPFGIVGFSIFCPGFLSFVIFVVYKAPRSIPESPTFRLCFGALWRGLDPQRWWFCIVGLVFKIFLNLGPLLFGQVRLQLVAAIYATVAYVIALDRLRPYKFYLIQNVELLTKCGIASFALAIISADESSPVEPTVIGVACSAAFLFPCAVFLCVLAYHLYLDKISLLSKMNMRMGFAERLHDIVTIVASKTTLELRQYALDVSDNDYDTVDVALDTIQFTLLGLQSRWKLRWRASQIPFEIAVPGRLEGEMHARGLISEHDARVELRHLQHALMDVQGRSHRSASISDLPGSLTHAKSIVQGEEWVTRIFTNIDGNADDKLEQDEFVSTMLGTLEGSEHAAGIDADTLVKVFKYVDTNQNGSLSAKELHHAMVALPPPVFPESVPGADVVDSACEQVSTDSNQVVVVGANDVVTTAHV